jgi:DNA-binding response OmpR family regulator
MSPAGADSAGAVSKKRILIVDDNPEIRSMISKWLGKKGFEIREAADGDEALVIARAEQPALIVLDVMMPGVSGWEVARELKQDPSTSSIRIVVLTAIGKSMNEMTSPLYGADAFLDKPFDVQKLEDVIRDLLR